MSHPCQKLSQFKEKKSEVIPELWPLSQWPAEFPDQFPQGFNWWAWSQNGKLHFPQMLSIKESIYWWKIYRQAIIRFEQVCFHRNCLCKILSSNTQTKLRTFTCPQLTFLSFCLPLGTGMHSFSLLRFIMSATIPSDKSQGRILSEMINSNNLKQTLATLGCLAIQPF